MDKNKIISLVAVVLLGIGSAIFGSEFKSLVCGEEVPAEVSE